MRKSHKPQTSRLDDYLQALARSILRSALGWPFMTRPTQSSPSLVCDGGLPPSCHANIDADIRGISLSAHGGLPIMGLKRFQDQWILLYTSQSSDLADLAAHPNFSSSGYMLPQDLLLAK